MCPTDGVQARGVIFSDVMKYERVASSHGECITEIANLEYGVGFPSRV